MKHSLVSVAVITLCATLAGCGSTSGPDERVPSDAVSLDVRPVDSPAAHDHFSALTERERLVIPDADAWAEFWARLTAEELPRPALPAVDFTSEMVPAASMGSRPSGGYTIHVDQVAESDGQVYVVVREVSPRANCPVTDVLTAPVIAVRVPRRDAPVTFIERAEVRGCD